ncbi:hypothetical protein AURDEDRAFT_177014, partial [Auricularia subglabra TFB-10046 SS5]
MSGPLVHILLCSHTLSSAEDAHELNVNPKGKDCTRSLLQVHPVKRLFAREALADTWLTTHEPANDVVRSGRAAREFQPERG